MPDHRRRVILPADNLNHVETEIHGFLQPLQVPHGGTGKRVTLVPIHRVQRAAEFLLPPGLDLHEDQNLPVADHKVNLVPVADPHPPAQDLAYLFPEIRLGLSFAPQA